MPKYLSWRDAYEAANADLIERFPRGQNVTHPTFGEGVVAGYQKHYPIDWSVENQDKPDPPDYRSVVVDFDPHGREFIREGKDLDELECI